MTVPKSVVFKFADIEVRPSAFLVLRAGKPLPLESKAFRVLVFLLWNTGSVVKKEEILDAVWDDANVPEYSLTKSIAILRRQLGDDAREPKFIVTVHTEGYRFAYPVDVIAEEAQSGSRSLDIDGAVFQIKCLL